MRTIQKDQITYDEFIVLDKHNNPITGLVDANFTKNLYDPDGLERANITGGITVTVSELGNGAYRLNFTPDKNGNWFLILYHATYFAYGKGENYFCVEQWFSDIAEVLKRIVGLCQEHYKVFDTQYDARRNMTSGKIKIYPTALDLDNDTNSLAEYHIEAIYNKLNHMVGYKSKRVA